LSFLLLLLFSFTPAIYSEALSVQVRAAILTVMSRKTVVLWDVTPCSLVDRFGRFGGTCYLHISGRIYFFPEDGSRIFILNSGNYQTAQNVSEDSNDYFKAMVNLRM
jgi:hypothetical protein